MAAMKLLWTELENDDDMQIDRPMSQAVLQAVQSDAPGPEK